MANQKAQLIGRYLSGPKTGQPATQQVIIIDTDANLATFTQRNARTAITFPGDVQFDDFTVIANTATITRVAPVVDGDILNGYSMMTAYASDPKSDQKSRFPASAWILAEGQELALESFTS